MNRRLSLSSWSTFSALTLVLSCIIGCDEAKEFANKAKESIDKQVGNVPENSDNTSSKDGSSASKDGSSTSSSTDSPIKLKRSPQQVINDFRLLASKDIIDAHLEELAELEEGLEEFTELDLRGSRVTAKGMAHLEKFQEVIHLNASRMNLTPEGLAVVSKMPNLQVLIVDGNSQINDAALEYVSGLADLVQLGIRQTGVTDEGLAHLSDLTNLDILNIGQNQNIVGTGFKYLKDISLTTLTADRTRVVREGVKYIKSSKTLEVLDLEATNCSDNEMPDLGSCRKLRKLNLAQNRNISDKGVMVLKHLKELEELNLGHCRRVSNYGLSFLKGSKELKVLYINGTKCDQSGAAALKQLIPNLTVHGVGEI